MQTSRNGKLFLCHQEALALVAYPDGGHASAGFGRNDPSLKVGQKITIRQAFDWLKADLAAREAVLNKALKVPLSQPQFDAVVSLLYNAGNRYMPAVAALCNAREFDVAAALFPLCDRNKAGVQMAGLKARRLREQALFVGGDYGPLDWLPFYPGDPKTTKQQRYQIQPGDLG